MSTHTLKGGCQCGAVRYEISGEPITTAVCHCTTCRRANGAPVVAWTMFAEDQVVFTEAKPKLYRPNNEVARGFCADCGTPVSFQADYIPGLIDITVGSLDDPESVSPAMHYWHSKHLGWVVFDDSLPRHPEFPPQE